jgi:hypothetical protein
MAMNGFVKRYMRIDEVAGRFDVSTRTVRRWFLSGKTCLEAWHPAQRIGSKGLRFTVASVEEFEKRGLFSPLEWEDGELYEEY